MPQTLKKKRTVLTTFTGKFENLYKITKFLEKTQSTKINARRNGTIGVGLYLI